MNFTGTSIASCTATTMPPRAVPSSFVTTRPVIGTAVGKGLRLCDRVLADRAVEHEQRLVRRAGKPLGDDARDLLQLVHQALARVQPAGGVDDHDVHAARDRRVDRRRTRPRPGPRPAVPPTNSAPVRSAQTRSWSIGPGAKRVARADEDRLPLRDAAIGQLADEGRLARAVDADDEDDGRAARRPSIGRGSLFPGASDASMPLSSAARNSSWVLIDPRLACPLDLGDEPQGRRHAEVSLEQELLELLQRALDGARSDDRADIG